MELQGKAIWDLLEPDLRDKIEKAFKSGMPIEYITDEIYKDERIPLEAKNLFMKGIRYKFLELNQKAATTEVKE